MSSPNATDEDDIKNPYRRLVEPKYASKDFGGIRYQDTSSPSDLFRVLFVLGGPGVGKGTQCELMGQHYPTVHLSVGQLLREEQANPASPHQQLVQETLVQGKIVPVEISLELLQNAMKKKAQEMGKDILFLVDGFPRNFDNLLGWTKYMSESSVLWSVLVYTCPFSILEKRILERAKASGRDDDNLSSLRKRFTTFEQETMPVIRTLRRLSQQQSSNSSWSVTEIRGDAPLEQVWVSTQQVLNGLLLHSILTANAQLLQAAAMGDSEIYQRLCDPTWFEHGDKDVTQVMSQQEGEPDLKTVDVTNAQVDVISGTHVAVSYDRIQQGLLLREKRIWSHEGPLGWRNVHFFRIPKESQ